LRARGRRKGNQDKVGNDNKGAPIHAVMIARRSGGTAALKSPPRIGTDDTSSPIEQE
jgi:hypothetical protein